MSLRITLVLTIVVLAFVYVNVFAADSDDSTDLILRGLLETKISTATKYEKTTSSAPASITIISSEDIERFGYRTLDEALNSVVGFYTSYDRNYVYVGVRGFGRPTDYNNRILLLLNGHGTNENYYGSAMLGTDLALSFDAVERIEIIRGPSSALYGTGAMFAIVNVVTKSSDAIKGPALSLATGSHDAYTTSGLYTMEVGRGGTLMASALWSDIGGRTIYFREFDQLATNYGHAEGRDWDRRFGFISRFSLGEWTAQAFFSSRDKGIPTASFGTLFNDGRSKTRDQIAHVEAAFDRKFSASMRLCTRAYYDAYRYKGWYPYEGELTWDRNWSDWIGSEARVTWDLFPHDRMVGGIEYQHHLRSKYKYWNDNGHVYFDSDHPFRLLSLYVQNEYQAFADLSMTFGVRHDQYSALGSFTAPRGALVYRPTLSTTFKLLYGKAFRVPNGYETYYEDPISGYKASQGLKPEAIAATELIWEQRLLHHFFGSISVYRNRISNLIDLTVDPADSLYQYRNVDEVSARGIEVQLEGVWTSGIKGYVNYSFQEAYDLATDELLTNSPKHLAKAGCSLPFADHFRIAWQARYESERKTVQESSTDAYVLHDLNFGIHPQLRGNSPFADFLERVHFTATINNVFDVSYFTPAGYEHVQDAIEQEGRSYSVRLSYAL